MTVNFSSENHGGQKEVAHFFQELREKKCQLKRLNPVKLSFRNKGKIKTFFSNGELKTLPLLEDLPLKMIKRSSSNRREKLKEEILEHQEGGRNEEKTEIRANELNSTFPYELLKSFLMNETNIITLSSSQVRKN